MGTIDYYNKNAKSYFSRTVELNLKHTLDKFIGYLPDGAEILDVGCGSGRDSLYFIEKGFDVTAIDGSNELCKLASIHIGQNALNMQFSELNFHEVFDGVWACASLLHCTRSELNEIINKIIEGLKPDGIFYLSFKYGDFSELRDGRYYNNFTTKSIKEFLSSYRKLELLEIWKNSDVRDGRENELWLNVLLKKKSPQ